MPLSHSCHIVPPGTAVPIPRGSETTTQSCSCRLNLRALFPDGPPSPPFPLSKCELHELLISLPHSLQNSPWHVCFDTEHDGFSLQNFYRVMKAVHDKGESGIGLFLVSEGAHTSASSSSEERVLATSSHNILSEAHGVVLGCYTPEVPCLEHSQHGYFGSTDTFVFTFADMTRYSTRNSPRQTSCRHDSVHSRNESPRCGEQGSLASGESLPFSLLRQSSVRHMSSLTIPRILSSYRWAMRGTNKEFIVCANEFFGIGGGQDGAAIFVDKNILYGTSSVHCGTFDSPPLSGKAHAALQHSEFMVLRMVWFRLKERKDVYVSMDLPMREPCDCGRYLNIRGVPQRNASRGWHFCTDDSLLPFACF